MAWSKGPGNLTSISFGGTSVDAGMIEGFSLVTENDSYESALGVPIERGSVRKTGTCNIYDVSAINAIDALMVGRTESTIICTYSDAIAQTLLGCIIRIKPIIHPITDATRLYIAADGVANNSLTSNWVDLGPIVGAPTPTFDYVFQGVDGEGRPYFSGVKMEWEAMLPGIAAILPYTELTSGAQGTRKGLKSQFAVQLPAGEFMVLTDAYTFFNYADEDGNTPRSVRLKMNSAGAQWGDILGYSDGGSSATDERWDNAGASSLADDFFAGAEVEFTGFHTAEGSLTSFA